MARRERHLTKKEIVFYALLILPIFVLGNLECIKDILQIPPPRTAFGAPPGVIRHHDSIAIIKSQMDKPDSFEHIRTQIHRGPKETVVVTTFAYVENSVQKQAMAATWVVDGKTELQHIQEITPIPTGAGNWKCGTQNARIPTDK